MDKVPGVRRVDGPECPHCFQVHAPGEPGKMRCAGCGKGFHASIDQLPRQHWHCTPL